MHVRPVYLYSDDITPLSKIYLQVAIVDGLAPCSCLHLLSLLVAASGVRAKFSTAQNGADQPRTLKDQYRFMSFTRLRPQHCCNCRCWLVIYLQSQHPDTVFLRAAMLDYQILTRPLLANPATLRNACLQHGCYCCFVKASTAGMGISLGVQLQGTGSSLFPMQLSLQRSNFPVLSYWHDNDKYVMMS